jgi:hypothetical protein
MLNYPNAESAPTAEDHAMNTAAHDPKLVDLSYLAIGRCPVSTMFDVSVTSSMSV